MLPEPIAVTLRVASVLDALGIPYFIGGSIAGALHGVIRSTVDVDLVVEFSLEHVNAFVQALESDFYVDDEMIREAIAHQSSFNLIHLGTMFKVDIFISNGSGFERSQFSRRELRRLDNENEHAAFVTSAEDILLAKLKWYRMGGEVSDRQWKDVLNIVKVKAGQLDHAYLEKWAAELGISDLLKRLFES